MLSFRSIKNSIVSSWWVFGFALLCYFLYEKGLNQREHDFQRLGLQKLKLLEEKNTALSIQTALYRQINSQSDVAYIELVLKKVLGLTPEEEQKIFLDR